jgi:quercetin dioxygenase-like cupin family protein
VALGRARANADKGSGVCDRPACRHAGRENVQLAPGSLRSRVHVNVVRFAPAARNAWHAHAAGQTIHVTEGSGLIQSRGEPVQEMHTGDTVRTPAGEWHWHGATPDHFMTHLAIWERPEDGRPETEWGALVTDAEYEAAPAELSR